MAIGNWSGEWKSFQTWQIDTGEQSLGKLVSTLSFLVALLSLCECRYIIDIGWFSKRIKTVDCMTWKCGIFFSVLECIWARVCFKMPALAHQILNLYYSFLKCVGRRNVNLEASFYFTNSFKLVLYRLPREYEEGY